MGPLGRRKHCKTFTSNIIVMAMMLAAGQLRTCLSQGSGNVISESMAESTGAYYACNLDISFKLWPAFGLFNMRERLLYFEILWQLEFLFLLFANNNIFGRMLLTPIGLAILGTA